MTSRATALHLYRSILRAHSSYLPPEMRSLGDAYVKSEFRLHKSTTNAEQLSQFFTEWHKYLQHLEETARARDTLSAGVLDNTATKKGDEEIGPLAAASAAGSTGGEAFKFGTDMPKDVELNEEQLQQLAKLREEAQKAKEA